MGEDPAGTIIEGSFLDYLCSTKCSEAVLKISQLKSVCQEQLIFNANNGSSLWSTILGGMGATDMQTTVQGFFEMACFREQGEFCVVKAINSLAATGFKYTKDDGAIPPLDTTYPTYALFPPMSQVNKATSCNLCTQKQIGVYEKYKNGTIGTTFKPSVDKISTLGCPTITEENKQASPSVTAKAGALHSA
ncbi:hypothetical protein HK099_000504, partial [Clydaea vesicula]